MKRLIILLIIYVLLHNVVQQECFAGTPEYEIPCTGSLLPIKATCNGQEFYCTLDTGSNSTVINIKAKILYGKVIKTINEDRRSITKQSLICEGKPIKLVDYNLPVVPVTVLPLEELQKSLGFKIEAVFGIKQLQSTRIYINNTERRLSLLENVPLEVVENWSSCDLELDSGEAKINLELAGKLRPFVVCTAIPGYLDLEADAYDDVIKSGAVAQLDEESSTTETGTAGIIRLKRGVFQKGNFMGRSLAGCPVNLGEVNRISLRWLHQYDYIVDLAGRRFYYKSREFDHPLDPWVTFGMRLSFDLEKHEAIISQLGAGGLMKKMGVKEGDRLARFGQLKEHEINYVTVEEEVQKYVGGKIIIEVLPQQSFKTKTFAVSIKGK